MLMRFGKSYKITHGKLTFDQEITAIVLLGFLSLGKNS